MEYWSAFPPVHILQRQVAAAYGFRFGRTPAEKRKSIEVAEKFATVGPTRSWKKLPATVQESMSKIAAEYVKQKEQEKKDGGVRR